MVVTHTVSPQAVRLKLGDPSKAALPDEQIAAEIEDAAVVVTRHAGDTPDPATVNHAVKVVASFALLRESGGMTKVAEELDIREEINVEATIDSLRYEREEALGMVSPDEGRPSLHSLGTRDPPR